MDAFCAEITVHSAGIKLYSFIMLSPQSRYICKILSTVLLYKRANRETY